MRGTDADAVRGDVAAGEWRASGAAPAWRRLPIGAEVARDDATSTHFRVWAPSRTSVDVVIEGTLAGSAAAPRIVPLAPEGDGYFSGLVHETGAGTLYRYRLDGGAAFPDPASRFQPEGPHGPSCVVDPGAFAWSDDAWRGVALRDAVIYELHVGTFTSEGTWAAAAEQLPALAEIGITVIEMMPVADFPGRFGWGYDGVNWFAPTRLYGSSDDLRRFVDRAHALGLAVILDVVYNHLGPDGNYLGEFSPYYRSTRAATEWGDGMNLDGERSAAVREYILANAGYWVDEFHMDGLRLDATQSLVDESPRHIVNEIVERVRSAARREDGTTRQTLVVGENEPQAARFLRDDEQHGHALDALWNDDWHHSAVVALTGRDEAYFSDYRGLPQEFISAAKYGFLYQGQLYKWQQARRGEPTFGIAPARFIHFLENHDQLANSGDGERLHMRTSPGRLRALTTLMLLGPETPMLFMGEEFAASAPFLFFADHGAELGALVAKGRREFLSQFPSLATPEAQAHLADPGAWETFARCKLDHAERERNAETVRLFRDLIALRREDATLRARRCDGAVLSAAAFVLRFFGEDGDDRLLVVNLGRALHLDPAPEPLLAPPLGARWVVRWSSESPDYGGLGTPRIDAAEDDRRIPTGNALRLRPRENWRVLGESAVVLGPEGRGNEHEHGDSATR